MYINRTGLKTIDQIESEIEITEIHCRSYADEIIEEGEN
nr:MAG TPA: hypothetical protein [Caudoviricetes sp.]